MEDTMRTSIAPIMISLLFIPACGGGGDDAAPDSAVPPAAAALETKLTANMARFVPLVGNVESSLVSVLNPGTPMAQSVVVSADTQPGAAPNSVLFSGPYDGNGDGLNETTMSGRVTFASDPASAWSGLDGQVTVDVSIPLLGHVYRADVTFAVLPDQKRLSGTGTFTEPISGDSVTMTISASAPLVIKAADGTANAVANACANSLSGQVRLVAVGAAGTLTSLFNFNPTSPSVSVTGSSFTDKAGLTTALPDSMVDLRCGSTGSLSDWAATFTQDWACLPRESGQARLTITVAGPDSVTIEDEDPPGSGSKSTYQAKVLGANPYALRGFFIGGDVGSRYREDFNWTLSKDGKRFSQFSKYVYTEGPNVGKGGYCVGSARRG
jgi:hypothetical protein